MVISEGLIKNHIGDYIRLEGFGVLDGLIGDGYKQDYYKIIGIDEEGAILRGYRMRKIQRLPFIRFGQNAEIIDEKGFKLKESAF